MITRNQNAMPWLGRGAKGILLVALGIGAWIAWHAAVEEATGADLLIVAASTHDTAGVQRALDSGVRVDAHDGWALMAAASGGDAVTVRLLLAHGANPSAKWQRGYTPLMAASIGGSVEVIQLLIDAGAEVNQVTDWGQTPLGLAAVCGHERAVEALLARGASATGRVGPEVARNPPLVAAARSGSAPPNLLHRLIDAGADINAPDDEGTTPLMAAAAAGRQDLEELLIHFGAQYPRERSRTLRMGLSKNPSLP